MLSKILLHGSSLTAMGLLAWSFNNLPHKVAIHFGISGSPDAWASKTTYLIIGLITLGFTWLLFAGIPKMIKSIPHEQINIPNKEYWLTPEHIDEFQAKFSNYMYLFGFATQFFMLVVGVLVYQAQIHQTGISTIAMSVALVAYLLVTVAWVIQLIRSFKVPT